MAGSDILQSPNQH